MRDHPVEARLEELGRLRDAHPALATGPTTVRLASGPLLVVSRFDLTARHEYVAAFNAGTRPQERDGRDVDSRERLVDAPRRGAAGPQHAGRGRWRSRSGRSRPCCSAPTPRCRHEPPVRPALAVRADELTNLVQARATVATAEPVSVSFAVKRARGRWTRIAADGSPPYRGFLDPQRFRRRERVDVVALARWPDGTTTVSPVVTAVPRPR